MSTRRNLVILSLSTTMPGAQLLFNAARRRNYDAELVGLGDEAVVKKVNAAQEIICRIGPKSVAHYESLVSQLNPASAAQLRAVLRAFDKIESGGLLVQAGVPMPRSWVIDRQATCDTFPVVVKVARGNRGDGVELVESLEEFEAVTAQLFADNEQLLCQEYIAESRGSDKRLIMTRGGLVAAMQRRATSDDFRANLHQGATAMAYAPTVEEMGIAARALQTLGLSFGGVDLIDSKRGPLVLEVNPSPGFGISDVTGIDVPEEIVKAVMEGNDV